MEGKSASPKPRIPHPAEYGQRLNRQTLMKRIAIFGSYNSSCTGDMAILMGLANACRQIYGQNARLEALAAGKLNLETDFEQLGLGLPCKETKVIRPSLVWRAQKYLGRWMGLQDDPAAHLAQFKVRQTLKRADYLLIGGGNLIMDLYPFWPHLLNRVCQIARGLDIPYAFVGVGAGPISHESSRALLRECMQHARSIWFRDQESLAVCQRLLDMPNALVGPDLAFGLSDLCATRNSMGRGTVMAVNVAGVFGPSWPESDPVKYQAYLHSMGNLTKALTQVQNVTELVVYDSNRVADSQASKAFVNELHNAGVNATVTHLQKQMTVRETIDLCSRADLALVTRLHAGLLAHLAGCRLIAVDYQPKVANVMTEHGITNAFIDLNDLIDNRVSVANLPDLLAKSLDRRTVMGTGDVTQTLLSCLKTLDPALNQSGSATRSLPLALPNMY